MPVASGKMQCTVTIYAPEGTSDAHAGSPAEIATGVWASIEVLPLLFQQAERLAAGGLRGQTSYNIRMRYRSDLRLDYQLQEECHSERVFNIVTMFHDDKMQFWELTCVTA